jgi:hypothetical protein
MLQIEVADTMGCVVRTISMADPRVEFCRQFNKANPGLTAIPSLSPPLAPSQIAVPHTLELIPDAHAPAPPGQPRLHTACGLAFRAHAATGEASSEGP